MKLDEKRTKKYNEAVERNLQRFQKATNEELQNYATCSLNQAKIKLGIKTSDESHNDKIEGKLNTLSVLPKGEPICGEDGD